MNKASKTVLRTLGLLAFTVLLTHAPQAEAHRGRCGDGGLMSQLDLTEEQQTQIEAIRADKKEQKRAIFQNEELSREDKKQAIRDLRQQSKTAISAVLTEEQRQELAQLRQERQSKRMNKRLEKMTKQLSLDEAQVTSIREIFEDAQTQKKAIKDSDAPRKEKKEQFKALRDQVKTQVLGVLNEEQAEKFNQFMEKRSKRRGKRDKRGNRGDRE